MYGRFGLHTGPHAVGHTHIHNKMVRRVSGDGGTLLRRGTRVI